MTDVLGTITSVSMYTLFLLFIIAVSNVSVVICPKSQPLKEPPFICKLLNIFTSLHNNDLLPPLNIDTFHCGSGIKHTSVKHEPTVIVSIIGIDRSHPCGDC